MNSSQSIESSRKNETEVILGGSKLQKSKRSITEEVKEPESVFLYISEDVWTGHNFQLPLSIYKMEVIKEFYFIEFL